VVYLASQSPRRQVLLRQIGIEFSVIVPAVDETQANGEVPADLVTRLAGAKARGGRSLIRRRHSPVLPVLGADTCVVVDGQILGKPRDRSDGLAMLTRLSGRSHEVHTAVAITDGKRVHTALSISQVTFGQLDYDKIEAYWSTGEPADKAGAYAIQGRGGAFIRRLEGSYSGVVGLPLYETRMLLTKVGIDIP